MTALSGGALIGYGVLRRDGVGAGIGLAGAALATRALANRQLTRLGARQ